MRLGGGMSATGQPRRLSDLGMSASPPTPDYRCDAAKRRFGPKTELDLSPMVYFPDLASTLWAAMGSRMPLMVNSPTNSAFTIFSTAMRTRELTKIWPGMA
jgi:hypothetical protein